MEIAYLDTSALVKRYHKEEYSDVIDEIFEKCVISISELTIVVWSVNVVSYQQTVEYFR